MWEIIVLAFLVEANGNASSINYIYFVDADIISLYLLHNVLDKNVMNMLVTRNEWILHSN